MVRIRLKRVGKSKQPSYRVVVADQRSPRDGRIIEAIGRYNPRVEPSEVAIDTERARYWIERGAQPSEQVRKLLEIAAGAAEAPATPPKPTPAESVTPTRAGSVDEPGDEEGAEASEAAEPPQVSAEAPTAETEEAETRQEGQEG